MSSLFFDETLAASAFQVGATVTLSGAEAHHAVNVSRVTIGERVMIGNGAGVQATATVTEVQSRALTVVLDSVSQEAQPRPVLILAQALAKGDRDERAIEACTELGVDEIIPFQARRSVSRWNEEKSVKGRERWQKIVREASKQSLRYRIPKVHPPASLKELSEFAAEQTLLVLDPFATNRLSDLAASELCARDSLILLIGPEGGLDSQEIQALTAAGARAVRLGQTVLRTSTAGVAALSVINATLGRW